MNALELADQIEDALGAGTDASSMLRRQHEAIKQLRDALALISETNAIDAMLDPQRAVRVAKQALKDTENLA